MFTHVWTKLNAFFRFWIWINFEKIKKKKIKKQKQKKQLNREMSDEHKLSDQASIEILNSLIPPLKSCGLQETELRSEEVKPVEETVSKPQAVKINVPTINLPAQTESGGCPFFMHNKKPPTKQFSQTSHAMMVSHEWQTSVSIASEPVIYHDYLQLDKVLNAQFPVSAKYGTLAHDEHLFIVIHQSKSFNIYIYHAI